MDDGDEPPTAERRRAGGTAAPVSAFAVVVDFRLKPGARADFRAMIDDNARSSCAQEAGCLRFDVLEPHDEPDRVVLYEVYRDRSAFEAHLASAHYQHFAQASDPFCASKAVLACALVCEGGAS